jgi:hypothetical protein
MSKGTSGMSGSEVTDRRFLFHCYGNPNSRNSSRARETMLYVASSRGVWWESTCALAPAFVG